MYEKTHRYLKNDYQFFDALKIKDRKIRGYCNLLTKVKVHELEWSSSVNLDLGLHILKKSDRWKQSQKLKQKKK